MKNDEKDELVSLNDKLYDEFYVQELEKRLETDTLVVGGLLDFFSATESDVSSMMEDDCKTEFSCTCYKGGNISCYKK